MREGESEGLYRTNKTIQNEFRFEAVETIEGLRG